MITKGHRVSELRKPNPRDVFQKGIVAFALGVGLVFALGSVCGCNTKKSAPFSLPPVTSNPPSVGDLTESLKTIVDRVVASLNEVKDEASSQAVLPLIEEATTSVIGMGLDRLPESHKSGMIDAVRPMVNQLVQVLKRLYKLPGVQAVIEPAISPVLSRLQAFANVKAD